MDTRNVIDHYKYWSNDAIKAALDEVRLPFVVVCENFAHDFNISTVVRNVNAFTAKEVWIVGRRKYDKRGAVGTYNYVHVKYAPTTEEVIELYRAQGYAIIAVDMTDDAIDIGCFDWPEKSLMIFGQEQLGVSQEALDLADHIVYIPQYGSTRSLNVGVASGIAMHTYCELHKSIVKNK